MYESHDSTKKKSPILPLLGVLALVLIAVVAFLLFNNPDDDSVGSGVMDDEVAEESGETPGDTTEVPATTGSLDIGTTEGLKFKANRNEFAAIGSADPTTTGTLEQVISLSYAAKGTNQITVNQDAAPAPYLPATARLLQLMATNVENPELEITADTVTMSGSVPNQAYLDGFNQLLTAESGFTQVIQNNLVLEPKTISDTVVVNNGGQTTVTGTVADQGIADIITGASMQLFGEDTVVNLTVDETRFAGLTWSRYPEFIGGMARFGTANWEAGSVEGNAYVIVDEGLNFDSASSALTAESVSRVEGMLPIMLAGSAAVEIIGHTDSDGSDELNQTLSEQRAATVAATLRAGAASIGAEAALPPERFINSGQGESSPIATNDTDEGKAQNRRVEINIVRG